MKIAILIRRYITTGGAERYAVEVARRLAREHEVHVFAQEWDHEPERVTLHRVPLLFRKPRVLNQWWFSWETSRMARGFDVVCSHERVTRFDVMNVHVGTFVGGLWGSARGERKNAFRNWIEILTGPSIWAYLLLKASPLTVEGFRTANRATILQAQGQAAARTICLVSRCWSGFSSRTNASIRPIFVRP